MADREAILAATENRRKAVDSPSPTPAPMSNPSTSIPTNSPFDKYHDKRQKFRRLVDPGITRPNSQEVAYEAIRTLFGLAENLINHPGEEKYRRFKTTNATIRRKLVDPKGTLEYARELGFKPMVVDFQPYYVFDGFGGDVDLLVGHAVLKEFYEREAEKKQRLAKTKAEEKAAIEAQKVKTRLAFLDDRKTKMQIDERERQLRAARAAKPPSPEPETEPASPPPMPGAGHLLSEASSPANVTDD